MCFMTDARGKETKIDEERSANLSKIDYSNLPKYVCRLQMTKV